MKLHNLVNKLQQKVLEGLGDLDVVAASNTNDFMFDISPTIRIASDSFDEEKKVIVLTYEEW